MNKFKISIIATIALLAVSCSKTDVVGEGYQGQYTYTSPLEKKYATDGSYTVAHETHDATEPRVGKHQVWYPAELTSSNHRWPVVVLANGSNANASRYEAIFRHMASWGFIVMGNEDKSTWDGQSVIMSLQHVLDLNRDASSALYDKVDTTAIGLAGHSQGGVAVFNAATLYGLSPLFKALCMQSPTRHELAVSLGWPYSASLVKAPSLIMGGTGKADANTVCPLESLIASYDSITDQPAMLGRIANGADHQDVIQRGDAYTTAWMLYWLCGDSEAARCFCGDDAEMFSNTAWQDVHHKNM